MKKKRISEFKGVVLIALSLIVLASLISYDANDLPFSTSHPNNPPHNLISTFGAFLAFAVFFLFGWAGFVAPVFLIWLGIALFRDEPPEFSVGRASGLLVFILSTASLVAMVNLHHQPVAFARGGFFGFVIASFMEKYFGSLGAVITLSTLALLALALVTEVLISHLIAFLKTRTQEAFKNVQLPRQASPRQERQLPRRQTVQLKAPPQVRNLDRKEPDDEDEPGERAPEPPKVKVRIKEEREQGQPKKIEPVQIGDYHLPSMELFDSPPPLEARQIKEDLTNNARILEETLEDFGISVKVTDIERGPIITRYELEPAPGVKLNRIVGLGDDIALAMKAQSVRIVAPIPGKARVGVEVPNIQSSFVYLKEVLSSPEFQDSPSKLTMALGKDIAGLPVVARLDEMPHLLIAGTTGSGKTVCVNSVILSFLLKATPNELKMVMIDPKMVELAQYNGLPHLLCPVVTESKKASAALQWVVNEMEHRYRLLSEASARNIISYNEKSAEKMPYIVVIVDEFADLMMVSRDEVESAVTRLAQLSRAVGIHLVLATQRPSVDVITGVIKANLPARISFKVASKVDSRTVLDMNGADKLLGKGDMLLLRPQDSKLTRAQGALIKDKEVERVVDFIKKQAKPVYDETVLKEQQKSGTVDGEKDDLYDDAVRVVIETNQASVSILQRRMRLGYTRAARLIDMMEQEGIVGPYEGSKPRKLLVDRDAWLKKEVMKEAQG